MQTQLGNACLAFRYLYYVEAISLVDDKFYDLIERVAIAKGDTFLQNNIGSSNPESYSRHIIRLANTLKDIGGDTVKASIIKNEKLEIFFDN